MGLKVKWAALFGIAAVLFAGLVWPNLPLTRKQAQQIEHREFKAYWTEQFSQCRTLKAAEAVPNVTQGAQLDKRIFKDGSWLVVAWHDSHSSDDGSWNGSVFLDSNGDVFWSSHHFCGREGFDFEFARVRAGSLKQFYAHKEFEMSPLR